jgi:hypothetical protein
MPRCGAGFHPSADFQPPREIASCQSGRNYLRIHIITRIIRQESHSTIRVDLPSRVGCCRGHVLDRTPEGRDSAVGEKQRRVITQRLPLFVRSPGFPLDKSPGAYAGPECPVGTEQYGAGRRIGLALSCSQPVTTRPPRRAAGSFGRKRGGAGRVAGRGHPPRATARRRLCRSGKSPSCPCTRKSSLPQD